MGGWERKFGSALALQARDEELIVARSTELALEAEGAGAPSIPPPAAEIGFIIQDAGRRVCTDPQSGLTRVGARKGRPRAAPSSAGAGQLIAVLRARNTTAVYAIAVNGWCASIRLTRSMHDLIL